MLSKKGFTVVELLIVISLLAIIVIMVVNATGAFALNARFTGLINNFLADFSAAKLLASTENRFVAVEFNGEGNGYVISKQAQIGSLATWTAVKSAKPGEGKVFFDTAAVSDFAISSTGEIFDYPIVANADPVSLDFNFFIRDSSNDYIRQRIIHIFPYGGIKVEK